MAVEHLEYDFSLRQGTDRLNEVIDQSNEAITKATDAEAAADTATTTANQALANSEDTQQQLDTIVIDGDSSVEAAQARVSTPKGITYTVLKDRLDAGEQDLITHKADYEKQVGVVHNAEGYGVDVAGATDSASALQAAMDAAAVNGGEVFFPTGSTIRVDSALTFYDNVIFSGKRVTFTGTHGADLCTVDDHTTDKVDFRWLADGVIISGAQSYNPLLLSMDGLLYKGKHLHNCPYNVMKITDEVDVTYTSHLDTGEPVQDNWYGVFAVNNSGALEFRLVTFARVQGIAGSVVTLAQHFDKTTAQTYGFTTDAYAGCDYVIQSGTNWGRAGTVSANDANTLTLDDVSGLTQGDWIMIAPAGFSQYRYLGSCFRDAVETQNMYKYHNWHYGRNSRNLYNASTTTAWFGIDVWGAGLVPPTARVIRFFCTITYSGTSPFHFYFAADASNHQLFDFMMPAHSGGSPYCSVTADCPIEFNQGFLYMKTDQAVTTAQIQIMGYME